MNNNSIKKPDLPQIMVVDDTVANLKLLSEILTQQGYHVRQATDGTLALRSVAFEAPDLILLDVMMPGMDGYEVCRYLKSDEQSRNIPVIFISALDEVADKIKGFTAGGVDYITKPFEKAEVLARVETHLSLRRLQKELEVHNVLLEQEIAERKRVEKELQFAHDHLDQQVKERTAELARTNTHLEAEVTVRKHAEEELRKLNRTFRMLSACNEKLVRTRDEQSLLEDICRIIVEIGGYRLVWVGFAQQDEGKTIRPAACAGQEDGYLKSVMLTWADTGLGSSPTGMAIRTRKPVFEENMLSYRGANHWCTEAARHNYQSSIAIPLTTNGHVLGALSMYTHETRSFDPEEVNLLSELANDLAYGIMSMQTREERKKAEAALVESERRMSNIIDFLPDATFAIDFEGRIIAWNKATEEMTGVPAEQMMGKGNYEYSLPFYGVRRPILIDFVFGQHEEIQKEYHCIEKKGDLLMSEVDFHIAGRGSRVLWGTAGPLCDTKGNVVGAIESLRDITERKQMERKLRTSEIRYRTIFENTGTSMIIVEEDMIVSLCNVEFERITGYSKDEIQGKMKWTDFIEAENRDIAKDYYKLRSATIHAAPKSFETTIQDKEGNIRHVFVTGTIIIPETKQTIASIIDITDRKKLQAQVYQAQKMEAIGTLAGGIAHDFNNILTGIMGFTELLLTTYKTDDTLQNYLGRVYQAGERARSLVKQILTISRRVEQKTQPMQIAPIIKEVLNLMRSSLPTTIEIRQDIAISQGKGIVVADPTQIHQVLMNLCTNAAYAMRTKGGVLSVSLSEVEVDAMMIISREWNLQAGPYVKLTVRDTGHGMNAEVRDRIFEPYFTTKEVGEGTGLGLAVVHGISKNYGGAITVSSEPGKGTTFELLLPATKQDVEQRIESAEALPGGNECILYIDDEEIVVDLGKKILESLGYTVTAKTNSLEALEAFRAQPDAYDLVITDMTMPHMTGIDLAKALTDTRTDIPIILCTGYVDLISAEQTKEEGIHDFIMKPFVIAKLAKSIRKVLDRNTCSGAALS
ncbi:MAG: Sensor histidine kinase RcsC [Syntrophus sp. SKADARSKE-3]|nr:Sensor histidine kinase RcsC [Syntrophus sp. SKADARSKE-3]